jgi:hypothetical protein
VAAPVWRGRAAVIYLLGAVAGALLVALPIGLAGGLLRGLHGDRPWLTVPAFAAVACLAWLRQVSPSLVQLPENRRQVTQAVLGYGPVRGAAQFGFEMGTGVRTFMTAASPYVLATWLALYGVPWSLLPVAAVGFAFGRGLPNFIYLRYTDRAAAHVSVIATASDLLATAGLIILVAYSL